MDQQAKPHPIVAALFWIFLLTFFGGGLAVIVNGVKPFLSEDAFAIIAVVLFSEVFVMLVIGKSVQIISRLRQRSVSASGDSTSPPG